MHRITRTTGQGVADVLFGETFPVGILSHSWPRNNQIPVNLGDAGYDPLFPYGFSIYVNGDIDKVSVLFNIGGINV